MRPLNNYDVILSEAKNLCAPLRSFASLRMTVIALVLALTAANLQAKPTANEVLSAVEKNYNSIRDYVVDVEVSIDSTQMHMPPTKATVYYERPDKVKVVAKEGFAVLPRDAFPGNPVKQIRDGFNTAYAGITKLDGVPAHVITLVPKGTQQQGTMKLYVEKRRTLILGTDAESNGSKFGSRWKYARVGGKYWLPLEIKAEMSGSMVPEAFDPGKGRVRPAKSGKGTAVVKFRNYRINKGVDDKVFSDKR